MATFTIRDLLRTATAYHDLSIQDGFDRSYNLWFYDENSTRLKKYSPKSNEALGKHFSRTHGIVKCILNFPEDSVKQKLLEKACCQTSLAITRGEFLPLDKIFSITEEALSGMGGLRYYANPPGFWQATGGAPFSRLVGIFSAPFDSRARDAAKSIALVKKTYDASKSPLAASEETTNTHHSEEFSAHQRWMFEPQNDLGKDITFLMLSLRRIVCHADLGFDNLPEYKFLEQLITILNKLAVFPDSVDKTKSLKAFFDMPLGEKNKYKDYGTFLAHISHRPECMALFLDRIIPLYTSEPKNAFDLLASCVKWNPVLDTPALNAAFKNALGITAEKNPSQAILEKLTSENNGIAPSITQIDDCLNQLPATLKVSILKDILTNADNPIALQLTQNPRTKEVLNKWMAFCLAYDPNIPTQLQSADITVTLSDNSTQSLQIKAVISGFGGSRDCLLYLKHEKELVLEHIATLSPALKMRCLLDITNSKTLLGLLFDRPRNEEIMMEWLPSSKKAPKDGGSRKNVARDLALVQEECAQLFKQENALSSVIESLVNRLATEESVHRGTQTLMPSSCDSGKKVDEKTNTVDPTFFDGKTLYEL